MSERIDPAVRLNMRIFKALDGMENSRLATTIPLREVRQFAEAFLAAADAAHSETPVLAQLGTGSGAGAQSDSGADSGHFARAVQSEGSTALSARLRAEALFIFDGPECSQDVRDVIEWFSGALAVAEAQEKT